MNFAHLYDHAAPCRSLYGHTEGVNSVLMTRDGRSVISGSDDGTIRSWDLRLVGLHHCLQVHDPVADITVSLSGSHACFCAGQQLCILDANEEQPRSLHGHDDYISTLSFNPDGTRLASGSHDKTVKIRDSSTGEVLQTLVHEECVRSVAFSQDEQILVSSSDDDTVQVWDGLTGDPQFLYEGHDDWIRTVSISPDSRLVASGSDDHTIHIWDAQTGAVNQIFDDNTDWVTSVAFSSTNQRLVSGSSDLTVRLYNLDDGVLHQTNLGHFGTVRAAVFSVDDRYIVSGADDSTIRIWDLTRDKTMQVLGEKKNTRGCVMNKQIFNILHCGEERTVPTISLDLRSQIRLF